MRYMVLLLSLMASLAQAETVEQLMTKLNAIQNDPKLYESALYRAEQRSVLCGHCHGVDGNSKRDHIPNLASQRAEYLLTQFELFGNGKRHDYVMSKLAKTLSEDERVDIAIFFSHQAVVPRESSAPGPLLAKGKKTYEATCVACHGADAYGQGLQPRLASQPVQYLVNTLQTYRDDPSVRPLSAMHDIAGKLSDGEISALAAYLSSLP
ncbi:c-type cytochrome [Aestuariirhabdus litorea]|uniref:Cytochrome biogenesis protein ResB n=1 Tax=Aestuariirhabdus litorea TaxID=2528527 RepID=A0A3P3VPH4_9GAMM|nr:c-type cytochrome [Aestuariirhabdus litorea]RRJ83556.1 cytochrome biogenesis protein ResB [Aestuariirhabdus litorea]RWW96777.1 c-type cytochrome [Endozoicomonadaceae bacterium GTF-13]